MLKYAGGECKLNQDNAESTVIADERCFSGLLGENSVWDGREVFNE